MIITLKRDGTCKQCGSSLPAGSRANWYRNGDVYGLSCHDRKPAARPSRTRYTPDEPLGLTLSRHDRYGLYTPDGTRIGSSCHCIDYPCCGH